MENSEQQISTPQGTQLYKIIGDLMDIVAQRYEKAPKAVRNLLMNELWKTLAQMSGDFCMAFVSREIDAKMFYINRMRCSYYSIETMFGRLVVSRVITPGFMGEIAKTKLVPMIKQINGLAKKYNSYHTR